MERFKIKEFLLDEGLCFDSDYLDLYLDLLETNVARPYISRSTQRHHAIPVSYYKKRSGCATRYEAIKMAEADPLNAVVNLLYSDHLLAHCYLVLCAKSSWFKYANANIFGKFTKTEGSAELLKLLSSPEFQKCYEESQELRVINSSGPNNGFYGKRHTKEQIEKIQVTKKIRRELGMYKQKPRSKEFRELIGASKRGKVYVSNVEGTVSKLILSEELDLYLNNGWVRGFILSGKAKIGKKHSEEHKQKISDANKGKHSTAVVCIELDKTFSSIQEAALELGIRPNAISNCLIGASKTSGGYHWRYAT